jgi:hypothetical protein
MCVVDVHYDPRGNHPFTENYRGGRYGDSDCGAAGAGGTAG